MPEIEYDPSEVERIKARYESGEGLHDPGQMYAHMLIVLAELDRLRTTPTGPWRAFVHDPSGWVHDDPEEALREIFDDVEDGRITVCCGTALPHDRQGDLRMEGTHNTEDVFLEIDLTDFDTFEEGMQAWKRAQAATEGLNRMAAAESSSRVEATNEQA
jgi:hypothetical protein